MNSDSREPAIQTIRLDEDQLKAVVDQVLVGLMASGVSGIRNQDQLSTAEPTDRGTYSQLTALTQMMTELKAEMEGLRVFRASQQRRLGAIEEELRKLQQSVKEEMIAHSEKTKRGGDRSPWVSEASQ